MTGPFASDDPHPAETGRRSGFTDSYGLRVGIAYLASLLFFTIIGAYEWQRIQESIDNLARERGRVLFDLIELTRGWNAHHGGVYVPVTEKEQPNPYLDIPERDLKAEGGPQLTMVNPALMTRQIAELAEQTYGVRIHITSLKPIRPGNAPDDWEVEALRSFEAGSSKERSQYFANYVFSRERVVPAYRFMAPLLVNRSCMKCHEKQGYHVGDIRGGISVSMPAEQMVEERDQRRKGSLMILLASFILTSALLHLMIRRNHRHLLALQAVTVAQEATIAERTGELEKRNDELQRELEERRRRERELRIAGAVFECAAEAITVTDANNRIVRVNPAFTAITGYTPAEVIGRNPRLLKSGRHGAAFYAEMWECLRSTGHWEGEIWNRHKSGDVFVEWLSISKIDAGDGDGQYLAVFHDITRRKEAEELLRYKAHHDALTDLPNRVLFDDRLQAAFSQAKRYSRNFALLMIDLDLFKEVNDTYGHPAGDQLLVEAARRLVSCVRESDTVARLGGDEFAIILSEMSSNLEAEQIAQRAVSLLAEPYYLDAGTARISGCVGIALYPQHAQDIEQLQRNADLALYAAKNEGRNTYRVYSPLQRSDHSQRDLL